MLLLRPMPLTIMMKALRDDEKPDDIIADIGSLGSIVEPSDDGKDEK